MSWNPRIPDERRIPTTKRTVGRPVAKPTHIICHITGTNSFESVRRTFLTSVSSHYLIDKDGLIYQFVPEEDQAWHAGINVHVHSLYAKEPSDWRRYRFAFEWEKYPADSVFLDEKLSPVQGAREATFVAREDDNEWPHYQYFKNRWGSDSTPINYEVSRHPNAYSVGIEILSVGAKKASANAYTEAMYTSLQALISDICERHEIPKIKGRIVGHEDVNPIQRYGWDPNQGFDWARVLEDDGR